MTRSLEKKTSDLLAEVRSQKRIELSDDDEEQGSFLEEDEGLDFSCEGDLEENKLMELELHRLQETHGAPAPLWGSEFLGMTRTTRN